MGETTRISWTDSTWNPWQGCRKVSPGCKNCYAEALVQNRMGRDFTDIRKSQVATFNAPLRWKQGRRIFTCSISDFFIEEADVWREEAWEIIRKTPQHTYQILTKRPERIEEHLPSDWDGGWPNVWLGTSIENQDWLWKRTAFLMLIDAKVRFLSCEPLLGPLPDLGGFLGTGTIQWVIVGGESGPHFRPMNLDWARDIRDQCVSAGVPFFYKQGSGIRSEMDPILDGARWCAMPP
jgi:protein gp37